MIGKLIFIIVAGGFIYLSSYSCAKYCQQTTDAPKYHMVWANHKAAMLADVYGLTPEEVGKPVMLFREVK